MTPGPIAEHLKQIWWMARNAGADAVEVLDRACLTRADGYKVIIYVALLDELDDNALYHLRQDVQLAFRGSAPDFEIVIGPVWQHSEKGPVYPLRDQTEDWLMDLFGKCERKLIALESGKKPPQQREHWARWSKRVSDELARRARLKQPPAE